MLRFDDSQVDFTQLASALPRQLHPYASTCGSPELDRKAHRLQTCLLPVRPNVSRFKTLLSGYIYELHSP